MTQSDLIDQYNVLAHTHRNMISTMKELKENILALSKYKSGDVANWINKLGIKDQVTIEFVRFDRGRMLYWVEDSSGLLYKAREEELS
jgi:hypothetical protein